MAFSEKLLMLQWNTMFHCLKVFCKCKTLLIYATDREKNWLPGKNLEFKIMPWLRKIDLIHLWNFKWFILILLCSNLHKPCQRIILLALAIKRIIWFSFLYFSIIPLSPQKDFHALTCEVCLSLKSNNCLMINRKPYWSNSSKN